MGSSIGRTARGRARVSSGYRCAARGGRWEHLVEGSASIVFLRNEGRRFTRLGALASSAEEPVADGCKASCVDWYGNARPIFFAGAGAGAVGV